MGEYAGGFVPFSDAELDNNYLSNSTREPTFLDNSGYILTDWFLGKVLQGPILPDYILETFDIDNIDEFVDTLLDEWQVVFSYNWRILTCIIFGFFMTLAIPIAGIIWCVMHSKGRCGAESGKVWHNDWKSRVVRQVSLTFFGLFWLFALWGIVWHFMADELMSRGMRDLPENIDYVVTDTLRYLNNSVDQLEHWVEVNFNEELYHNFNATLNEGSKSMDKTLFEVNVNISHFNALEVVPPQLYNVSLDYVDGDQERLYNFISDFSVAADTAEDQTNDFLQNAIWDNIIAACDAVNDNCKDINNALRDLAFDSSLVPDPNIISNANITPEDFTYMEYFMIFGPLMYHQMDALGGNFILNNKDLYLPVIDDMRQYFVSDADDLYEVMSRLIFEDPEIDEEIEEDYEHWFDVAYYVFMIPGMILVVVLFLYLVGYTLGLISQVGSDSKRHAANIICAATAIFFTVSFVCWMLTVLLFVGGAATQKLGCETLENPAESDLYVMLEEDINEELYDAFNTTAFENTTWVLPEMLEQCKDNQSIYVIFHLDDVYDASVLSEWRNYVDTETTIGNIKQAFDDTMYQVIERLDITQKPTEYPNVYDLETNMTIFMNKMEPVIDDCVQLLVKNTIYDILDATQVDILIESLNEMYQDPVYDAYKPEIEEAIDLCLAFQTETIEPFNQSYIIVSLVTDSYWNKVEYLADDIFGRIDSTFNVLRNMVNNLPDLYEDFFLDVLEVNYYESLTLFDWFADFSYKFLYEDLGRCAPFYDVYQAGINYSCYEVVDPINNIWAAVGLTLCCFVPILIVACRTEDMFRMVKGHKTLWIESMEPVKDENFKGDVKPYYMDNDSDFEDYDKYASKYRSSVYSVDVKEEMKPKLDLDTMKVTLDEGIQTSPSIGKFDSELPIVQVHESSEGSQVDSESKSMSSKS